MLCLFRFGTGIIEGLNGLIVYFLDWCNNIGECRRSNITQFETLRAQIFCTYKSHVPVNLSRLLFSTLIDKCDCVLLTLDKALYYTVQVRLILGCIHLWLFLLWFVPKVHCDLLIVTLRITLDVSS